MLDTPDYRLTDPEAIRDLVRSVGWATMVSATGRGEAVVSHLPIVVEPGEPLTVVGHLGRPDDVAHQLGEVDVTLSVAGPGGYVSPSWYGADGYIPTWNYVVVHLTGRPVVLDADETYDVLVRTVERFEQVRADPYQLPPNAPDVARGTSDSVWSIATNTGRPPNAPDVARGTSGFRLVAERVEAKAKLSQDKPREIRERVAAALDGDPDYASPALAALVRDALA